MTVHYRKDKLRAGIIIKRMYGYGSPCQLLLSMVNQSQTTHGYMSVMYPYVIE